MTEQGTWIEERHKDFLVMRYRVEEVLFEGQSPFQKIQVVRTAGHGRMLLNDGLVMLTERDEAVYHEMIAHVPLFVHPDPRRVLVIGGGDGGSVREVLKHRSIEHCRLVEVDEMVVDACRKFIPQTAACLDDPRVEVTIADGVEFVASTTESYDVILVDSTDPIGPAKPLFGPEFYGNVKRVLGDRGIVVSQAESPFYESQAQKSLMTILNDAFDRPCIYNYSNLTYPGSLWSFAFCSKGPRSVSDFDPARVADCGIDFYYYNPDVHRGAFALPQFMRENLHGLTHEV
jgi:spermidine synthase